VLQKGGKKERGRYENVKGKVIYEQDNDNSRLKYHDICYNFVVV